uniref:ATP synthase F0 subunit 8 n=1 Tax=Paralemanea sp. TaxID=2048601 RepID=A0A343UXZ6_9FLOR|nr:ATP synthase F0 subunit 8 [Paralemanea sp.]
MPQLDRIIVFTQIFWLFVIFSLLYIVLIHFFLPQSLKSLKSRDLVIGCNIAENNKVKSDFLLSESLFSKTLSDHLSNIKQTLLGKTIILTNDKFNPCSINSLIFNPIFNIVLYCDTAILNKISLKFKTYNFIW